MFLLHLYDGDLINYNISTPANLDDTTTPTSFTSAELTLPADKNTISITEYPFQSNSLVLSSSPKTIDASKMSSLQVDVVETPTNMPAVPNTIGVTTPLPSFLQPVLSSTSEPIPSQLPSPKPSLSSQTSVLRVIVESESSTVTDST